MFGQVCLVPAHEINAAAAGTWTLGDLTVNRIGFGARRLTGSAAFDGNHLARSRFTTPARSAGDDPGRCRRRGAVRCAADQHSKAVEVADRTLPAAIGTVRPCLTAE